MNKKELFDKILDLGDRFTDCKISSEEADILLEHLLRDNKELVLSIVVKSFRCFESEILGNHETCKEQCGNCKRAVS